MIFEQNKQKTVIEVLKSKKCTFSAEIIPPRNGSETNFILRQISRLNEVPVDFISVTKGAGGSLRGGTLPISQLIKTQFNLCALAHFTCRDFTIEEIENNLMDHHYFGVHNILALRGDPPDGQPDHFKPAPNRHSYAFQLVEQIKKLNQGEYLMRAGFDKEGVKKSLIATQFCIGVAAHPEEDPIEQSVEYLKRKVDAGAQFAITQMIYNAETYSKFLDLCQSSGAQIPILPGLRILTNPTTAKRMVSKFKIKVPQKLIDALEKTTDKDSLRKIGLDFTFELSQKLINAGAPGIHVFVMNDESTAFDLFQMLKK